MTGGRLPTAPPVRVRAAAKDLLLRRGGRVLLTTAALAAGTAAELVGPLLLGTIIDAVAGGGPRGEINRAAAGFLAVTVIGGVLAYAGMVLGAGVGEDVLAELRGRVFDRTLALPLALVERAGTGELLARVTGDVTALSRAVRESLPQMAVAAIHALLTAGALVLLSPSLAAAALVAVPPVVWAGRWYARRSGPVYRRERERSADLTRGLQESFDGAAAIRTYRLGSERLDRLVGAGAAHFSAVMAGVTMRNVLRPGVVAGQFAALVAVAVVGAAQLGDGRTSLGVVTAAAFYLLRLLSPIELLLEELDELQTAQAALARLIGLLDSAPEAEPAHPVVPEGAAVTLAGVRFAYRAGHEVLHGVDLDLAAGERLALVGASGAGKTTIAKLLARVHRPDAGTITVGGVPLERLPAAALRRHVLLVTQEARVFLGTLADNLRLAAPDADDPTLRAALAAVGACWVEALPEGLATTVGAGGHRLAAAQVQQLALARVILAEPAVVVLDEATADFDTASARAVDRALDAALRGRTVVAIAHRLHGAVTADRIAVVDGGRITETGSHDQLRAAGGSYAALWRRWHQHIAASPDAARRDRPAPP